MNTRSLETLNLGHNNITNEGIHRLKEGLLQNKSLLRVGLQAAKLSCEGRTLASRHKYTQISFVQQPHWCTI